MLFRFLAPWLAAACVACAGCAPTDNPLLLPAEESAPPDPSRLTLVARIVHISDTHIVDSLSPARFAGVHELIPYAWREWESYSTQLLDGVVRTANRIHAGGQPVDFALHTGDACDNAHSIELEWFLNVMDGKPTTPLSGPDDRPPDAKPRTALDPYAAFQPQGLYRTGVHGNLPSIPWYGLFGNHDTYALGTFPVVTGTDGGRTAPLPLSIRPGIVLPVLLDPVGSWSHGNVTPANPGPPPLFEFASYVAPNPARAFFNRQELMRALATTATGPAAHGFPDPDNGPPWYSLSPVPGVRLIGLDTSDQPRPIPTLPYSEGCISEPQRDFLRGELAAARDRGELIIVASHHPSQSLQLLHGSALAPSDLRDLLNACPNVVLHLAGHNHRNRVADRGGYVEIETCSTLDPPQEGRVIEIWRDNLDGSVQIAYRMFSHIEDTLPPLGDDPLREMRVQARAIAEKSHAGDNARGTPAMTDADLQGTPTDRDGVIRLAR